MRDALVAALVACAHSRPSRWRTRRFLTGLSADELQFIAGYLGSRILACSASSSCPRKVPMASGIPCRPADSGMADSRSQDREHKMILLVEFLGRSGLRPASPRRGGISLWN